MSLEVSDFAAVFEATHGHWPYLWQKRLLREVVEGGWPTVIAAPTGAGKTAVLDVALFHLAMRVDTHPRGAPLRIVFAVDRRIIVDQAFERAKAIEKALAEQPALAAMADALQRLSGGKPLHVEELRGGMPREDDWARTPHQPTILCTTVDQLGSRLLFRGYGVADGIAPIHAGLLGQDTLLILDEAHLSVAFATTLDAVKARQALAEIPPGLPFATTRLTATPRDEANVFHLSVEERGEDAISRRLTARKHARLADPKAKPGKPGETAKPEVAAGDGDDATAKSSDPAEGAWRFVDAAKALRERLGGSPVVAVVVNRVALARAVHGTLAAEPNATAILLTGRVRPAERDALIGTILARLKRKSTVSTDGALFVVATQAIEAGADFDFDALVTQIAPLDALAQRFGRLARAGERGGPAPATIVALPQDIARKADDPVYGDRMRLTWEWLQGRTTNGGAIDLGPDGLAALIAADPEGAAACRAEAPDAPLLRAADVDFLATTNPAPHPDPLLPLYLHGDPRIETDVSIVWRADLAEADLQDVERAVEIVSAMPPSPGEALSIPINAARQWLRRGMAPAVADVPQRQVEGDDGRGSSGRSVLRWRRKDPEIVLASAIRPGDTLVVPVTYGGCDRFGWNSDSTEPVDDVADIAAAHYHKRGFSLRLHPALWETLASPLGWADDLSPWLTDAAERRLGARALVDTLFDKELAKGEEVASIQESSDPSPTLTPNAAAWRRALDWIRSHPKVPLRLLWRSDGADAPDNVVILVGREPVESDDGDRSSFLTRRQNLKAHVDAVEALATRSASALRLSPQLSEALRLAACLHDEGKRDERFQAYLGVASREPLAKSGERRTLRADRRAWIEAGFSDLPATSPSNGPKRRPWRHEVLSVRLAAATFTEHPPPEDVDLDLVLWLIGTHHGQGRPFFRHDDPWDSMQPDVGGVALTGEAGPHRLDFEWAGEDWAGLFERLRRRYGAWGLAYLEAVLRLADHRASEEGDRSPAEEQHGPPS